MGGGGRGLAGAFEKLQKIGIARTQLFVRGAFCNALSFLEIDEKVTVTQFFSLRN